MSSSSNSGEPTMSSDANNGSVMDDSSPMEDECKGLKRPLLASTAPAPKIKKKPSKEGAVLDKKAAKLLQRKQLQQELLKKQQQKLQEKLEADQAREKERLEREEEEKKKRQLEAEERLQSTNNSSPSCASDSNNLEGTVNIFASPKPFDVSDPNTHSNENNQPSPLPPDKSSVPSSEFSVSLQNEDSSEKHPLHKSSENHTLSPESDTRLSENTDKNSQGESIGGDVAPDSQSLPSEKSCISEGNEEISNEKVVKANSFPLDTNTDLPCEENAPKWNEEIEKAESNSEKKATSFTDEVKKEAVDTIVSNNTEDLSLKSDAQENSFNADKKEDAIKAETDVKDPFSFKSSADEKPEEEKLLSEADSWGQLAIKKDEKVSIKSESSEVKNDPDRDTPDSELIWKKEKKRVRKEKDKETDSEDDNKSLKKKKVDSDGEKPDKIKKKKKSKNKDHFSDSNSSDDEGSRGRGKASSSSLAARPKIKNVRKNIRDILSDDKLEEGTLAAQKEEKLRLQRLQEKRNAIREYMEKQEVERLVAEVSANLEAVARVEDGTEAIPGLEGLDSAVTIQKIVDPVPDEEGAVEGLPAEEALAPEEAEPEKMEQELPLIKEEVMDAVEPEKQEPPAAEEASIKKAPTKTGGDSEEEDEEEEEEDEEEEEEEEGSADSDVVVLSEQSDEEEDDVNNSGGHINDEFNQPDAQGRVLVNVAHPESEEDIFLAPQLALAVKPHQIGGIRFLYENIIESVEKCKTSNGFGCILAHSMGLGKTLQIVSFTDVFLRHTEFKSVLIIVPINTLQNWLAEYNHWLPEVAPPENPLGPSNLRPRNFKVYVINDAQKNLSSRTKVIKEWQENGGVLLMGYELYRQLSLKKPKKPKKKKKKGDEKPNLDVVDIEEEDENKKLLDDIHLALVRPGPDLVICDEGHRIKNAHANISQALKNIRTKRRVVLTGYPLQNNLMEYWCMVDFVRPNYLGTKTEFSNMFERPIQNGQCVDSTPQDMKLMRYRSHVLHSLLEGFVQRRGHTVLQASLPCKHEHVLFCRMTAVQRKLYSAFMAELSASKAVANPLKAFAVCCKIWNHPDVLYNFLMKRFNEDFDLDLDEIEHKGKARSSKSHSTNWSLNLPNFNQGAQGSSLGPHSSGPHGHHAQMGSSRSMGSGHLPHGLSGMQQHQQQQHHMQQQQQHPGVGDLSGMQGMTDPNLMSPHMMHSGMSASGHPGLPPGYGVPGYGGMTQQQQQQQQQQQAS